MRRIRLIVCIYRIRVLQGYETGYSGCVSVQEYLAHKKPPPPREGSRVMRPRAQ